MTIPRILLALSCAAMLGVAGCSEEAEDSTPAKPVSNVPGSVSVRVKNADGEPAVELKLKVVQDLPIGAGGPGGPREKVFAEPTTDKDGAFRVADLKPGSYRIQAGNRDIGWIYQDVEIEPEREIQVQLKLVKIKGSTTQSEP
jgi:hypothetical protein